jgi:NitT/TauT family transport system permease protein
MNTKKLLSFLKFLGQKLYHQVPGILSVLILFIGWHYTSKTVPSFLLPSPLSTLEETYKTFFSAEFIYNAYLTLKRSITGFLIAFAIAHILILSSAYSNLMRKFWQPLILLGLSIPATIGVFVTVVMLGSRGPVALVVIILILTPLIYLMLYPAFRNINEEFSEMASVFRLSRLTYVKYVIVPQIAPYYLSTFRAGLNDAWKLVILAEVFSFGDGVGHQILQYFNLFSIRPVLAWFISFFAILVAIEYCIFQPLERLFPSYSKKE